MKNFTERLIALGLIGSLAITGLAACNDPRVRAEGAVQTDITKASEEDKETEKEESSEESRETEMKEQSLVGGWAASEDMKITDDLKKIFDKAMEGLDGVDYEPLAYLSSQIVAGKNHCFLCKATTVTPGAVPGYALVYIYEKLDGGCEILNIQKIMLPSTKDAYPPEEELPGGWNPAEDTSVTSDIEAVLKKASEALTGAEFEPVAYLGSQVVAGTNHAIFCKQTPSIPSPDAGYSIVYIYEDLNGNCEITKIDDLTISLDR